MNDITQSSKFLSNSPKVYDIHFQRFFKNTFQFLLFFSSTCNLFSSLRGHIQFPVIHKV